jgi:hypothetical protein
MVKLKFGDIIIITVVFILAVSIFFVPKMFLNQNKKIAVISIDGKVYKQIDLSQVKEPQEIVLPLEYENIIEINNNEIYFKHSDCPDKLCVKSGKLKNVGDFAACLPNRVSVSITGDNPPVDSIAK